MGNASCFPLALTEIFATDCFPTTVWGSAWEAHKGGRWHGIRAPRRTNGRSSYGRGDRPGKKGWRPRSAFLPAADAGPGAGRAVAGDPHKRNQLGPPARRSGLDFSGTGGGLCVFRAPSTQGGTPLWQRAWNICHSGICTGRRRSNSCWWPSRLRPRDATSTTRLALSLSRSLPR